MSSTVPLWSKESHLTPIFSSKHLSEYLLSDSVSFVVIVNTNRCNWKLWFGKINCTEITQSWLIQSAPTVIPGLLGFILSVPQLPLKSGDYTKLLPHKDVVKLNYICEALRYYHDGHQRKKH